MEVLARIALQEQADKIAEKQAKASARQRALDEIKKADANETDRRRRAQSRCDHLLGSHKVGVKPREPKCGLHKDYLSDKSVRVYCCKCRFEWRPGDRRDFILRRTGRGLVKQPNPTKKSWVDINRFFYEFENSADLTSKAFRLERVEPETIESEEARILADTA
jgi:hypothetical protein